MNAGYSFMRRIATRLARRAANLLPESRSQWAKAIINEIDYVPSDFAALRWAIGCLFASYRERLLTMNMQSSRRWVMSLEMLVCFVPLTLLGLAVVWAFLSGKMALSDVPIYLSLAAIGPIGLVVAFRTLVLLRTTLNAAAITAMCILAAWTSVAFSFVVNFGNDSIGQWWREFLLIAFLPAVGCAHLIFVAKTPPPVAG